MTLQEYLEKNLVVREWTQGGQPVLSAIEGAGTVKAAVTDHRLSVQSYGDGRLRIMIHPMSVDGDTVDFYVSGNALHGL